MATKVLNSTRKRKKGEKETTKRKHISSLGLACLILLVVSFGCQIWFSDPWAFPVPPGVEVLPPPCQGGDALVPPPSDYSKRLSSAFEEVDVFAWHACKGWQNLSLRSDPLGDASNARGD
ncbi:uncharacterized protein LOC112345689 [Selaginella moellendorffii]|uniref:uncharacterized protein LOC112345689 n=1 Tax=Selaginella moellendorffii TaxID=88036 RepID=UPI000D1CEEB5|nr:uncharacterized protein LOC112345689 [Selaginella moellendorffii]XP_024528743.1 uncharacterized protein LOC112345689 [Selaginella moellendorffii]|eukprot:XP_024528742.1 uncharacterized protein LOC112345689 [Selaginella moellendorffii]